MVTLVCSADWQLGMRRWFFGPEAQHRYTQARIDTIEALGALAADRGAAAVLVAGDVFETNQVERQVVTRATAAMAAVPVPVLLLPGNHDCLEPGTLWTSPEWLREVPANVRVLDDPGTSVRLTGPDGSRADVVGAPWRSRRPVTAPVVDLLDALADDGQPDPGVPRILLGHGMVDALAPATDVPQIPRHALEEALTAGMIDFAVLGDRHSTTSVGDSGRIWYPGTPEVTDCGEVDPGNALVVTLEDGECTVEVVHIGQWHMVQLDVELDGSHDIDAVEVAVAALPDQSRTYLRLGVVGTLDVESMTALEMLVDSLGELFAGVSRWESSWDVRPLPDDAALSSLGLTGAARSAMVDLLERAAAGDETATGALALLHRLASTDAA